MPSLPSTTSCDQEVRDREIIEEVKMVAEYNSMSLQAALDLPCDFYALCLKKAFIKELSRSDKGKEFLDTVDKVQVDIPDIENEFFKIT